MEPERSPDRLTLTLDWPEVTLTELARVAQIWASLVQSVSQKAAGKDALKWVVTRIQFGSPLDLETRPRSKRRRVDPAIFKTVSHAVVNGIHQLETTHERPDWFSTSALMHAKELSLLSNLEAGRRILVSNGTAAAVNLSLHTAATVDVITGPIVESYGTIEGTLEGLFTHEERRFYVYNSLSGKRVRCRFDERVPLSEILAAYEKRVAVSGLIRSRASGEKVSIDAATFTVFAPDADLPSLQEILSMWGQR